MVPDVSIQKENGRTFQLGEYDVDKEMPQPEVLNSFYPRNKDLEVQADEYLDECHSTFFGGVINIPNKGNCIINGFAKVNYEFREFGVSIDMPVELRSRIL